MSEEELIDYEEEEEISPAGDQNVEEQKDTKK